jgi:hypothetical protein
VKIERVRENRRADHMHAPERDFRN